MSKICSDKNPKSKDPSYVCNPTTGNWIKIGGATHQTLIKNGLLKGNHQLPATTKKPVTTTKKPATTVKKAAPQNKTATTSAKPKATGERKAPGISATSVPVGTEMAGKDGLYVVKLRKNGSQYWAKCSFKGSNCQTQQQGGNPLLAALPTLTELAIPVGLTAASHFAHNYYEGEQAGGNPTQRGRPVNKQMVKPRATPTKKSNQKGGNPLLAAASELAVPAVLTASAYYLSKNKNTETTQQGGNPFLLKAASDLIVPIGLTAGAHWLASMKENEQTGGNPFILQTIADLSVPIGLTLGAYYLSDRETEQIIQAGGAEGLPIIDDPIMNSYLGMKGIGLLTPQTLIPLGILLAVFSAYKYRYDAMYPETATIHPELEQSGGVHEEILNMVDKEDLDKYLKLKRISELTPQTELPFAALMGPDVFKQYVKEMGQKSNGKVGNGNRSIPMKKNNQRRN